MYALKTLFVVVEAFFTYFFLCVFVFSFFGCCLQVILEKIGKGAFASVFKARRVDTGQLFALKKFETKGMPRNTLTSITVNVTTKLTSFVIQHFGLFAYF